MYDYVFWRNNGYSKHTRVSATTAGAAVVAVDRVMARYRSLNWVDRSDRRGENWTGKMTSDGAREDRAHWCNW